MKKLWSLAAAMAVTLTIGMVGVLPAQAAETTAKIWGIVTLNGSPVKNQSVTVQTVDYSGYATGVTDATGKYSIEGLTPGSYSVLVVPAQNVAALPTYLGNKVREPESTRVSVALGGAHKASIHLVAGGSARGKIVFSSGKGVKGASVILAQVNGAGYGWATTNASGKYVVKGLPAGKYSVTVSSNGYAQTLVAGGALTPTVYVVRAKKTTAVPTFRLPRVGSVVGVVKTSATSGDGGVVLYPRNPENQITGVSLGAKGKVLIKRVVAGTYDVWVNGKGIVGKVTVRSGKTAKLGTVTLARAAKIWGYLKTYSGKTSASGSISVVDSKGRSAGYASVAPNGKYVVTGLGAGTFTVVGSPNVFAPEAKGNASSKGFTVTVKTGKTAKKDVVLRKEAVVKGFVKSSKGKGIEGVSIFANGAWGTTNAKGFYVLHNVAPGATVVNAYDMYEGGYLNSGTKSFTARSGKTYKKYFVLKK